MTTIVAVKKNGTVAIAADSLTTFGDTRLGRQYKGEHDKILEINGSFIGLCGSSAHTGCPAYDQDSLVVIAKLVEQRHCILL